MLLAPELIAVQHGVDGFLTNILWLFICNPSFLHHEP